LRRRHNRPSSLNLFMSHRIIIIRSSVSWPVAEHDIYSTTSTTLQRHPTSKVALEPLRVVEHWDSDMKTRSQTVDPLLPVHNYLPLVTVNAMLTSSKTRLATRAVNTSEGKQYTRSLDQWQPEPNPLPLIVTSYLDLDYAWKIQVPTTSRDRCYASMGRNVGGEWGSSFSVF